jgi:hypothetical protein
MLHPPEVMRKAGKIVPHTLLRQEVMTGLLVETDQIIHLLARRVSGVMTGQAIHLHPEGTILPLQDQADHLAAVVRPPVHPPLQEEEVNQTD